MTKFLLSCITGLAFTASTIAADAVFSHDGKFVTLIPLTETAGDLWRVDLKTKIIDNIRLDLPKGQSVRSLAGGAEGELLVLTGEAVYVHDANGTKKLCDTSGVEDAKDLATVPPKATGGMANWLIVTGIDKDSHEPRTARTYYARKPGEKSFKPVFCRRIDQVGQGCFTPGGRYFFQSDNALWEGAFEYIPDNGPGWNVALVATSIAPLAYCDSNTSNTGQYRVSDAVAVAGKNVYVTLSGRHGADLLLRVTMPAKPPTCDGTDSGEALVAHYAMQGKVLSSVKVLANHTNIELLAAVVINGEERVFYIIHPDHGTSQMMLWTSRTDKAEVIEEFKDEQ